MQEVLYQLEAQLATHLRVLTDSQRRGLALWVCGTLLAKSACQNAVITALLWHANFDTLRQRLREWLYDGKDKARRCQRQLDVTTCFVPLLAWVLSLWEGRTLVLALDATGHQDHLTVLAVAVVYRGNAIPIAWHILPAHQKGEWNCHWKRMLTLLAPALKGYRVLVLTDRGMWSPDLYAHVQALGLLPVMRAPNQMLFRPHRQPLLPARALVPREDTAWIGAGHAFQSKLPATLIGVWLAGHKEPCFCLTSALPKEGEESLYALRMWIERGFRVLKSEGWQWEGTRRRDPVRASRHWLVLAVATLLTLLVGAAEEDMAPRGSLRIVSVFRRGLMALQHQLHCGRLRTGLRLRPQSLPRLGDHVEIVRHCPPAPT